MWHILLYTCLFFLSGCVSIPKENHSCNFSEAPLLDPTIEKGVVEGVISLNETTMEPSLPRAWWEIFENKELSYLIERGLCNNPTLQAAIIKIEKANQEGKVKQSALFPTIGLDSEVNAQDLSKNSFFRSYAPVIPADVTEYTVGLDFSYEFDFWGKRKNLYEAALGKEQVQVAEKAQADLVISAAIAAVYFKLQAAFQQLDFIARQEEVAASLIRKWKKRQEHALDSSLKVIKSERKLLVIQQQALLMRESIELIQHRLLILLGEGPDSEMSIAKISLDSIFQVPVPSCLPFDLLSYRPDLMAQIWRVDAATHETAAAKADFYPNINLNALVGLDTIFISSLFSSKSFTASAAPALHLPIFTAGRIRANLESKRAAVEEEIQVYNELLLEAAKDVADRIVNLRTANQNLLLQNSIVEKTLQSHYLIDLQIKNALADTLEGLESNLNVLQQEWLKVETQYQYHLAVVELIRALGGGYSPISMGGK